MPQQLGALLIQKRLITAEQRDEGLRAQVLHRGRLGTNLVELHFLSLAQLSRALLDQHGMAMAKLEELRDTTAQALMLVSARVARDHLAIPLRVEGGRLVVAMASAFHPPSVEALERALRASVEPRLAPELVILHFLEVHYGVATKRPAPVSSHRMDLEGAGFFAASDAGGFLTDDGAEEFLQRAMTPAGGMKALRPTPPPPAPAAAAPAKPRVISVIEELASRAPATEPLPLFEQPPGPEPVAAPPGPPARPSRPGIPVVGPPSRPSRPGLSAVASGPPVLQRRVPDLPVISGVLEKAEKPADEDDLPILPGSEEP